LISDDYLSSLNSSFVKTKAGRQHVVTNIPDNMLYKPRVVD